MRVLVAFNVVKAVEPGLLGREITQQVAHLIFQGTDERLGPGIVVGIGASRLALEHVGVIEQSPKLATTILAASVTVKNDSLGIGAIGERHFHGITNQISPHVIGQAPPHDTSGAKIHDDSQVMPTRLSRHIGDISHPDHIGRQRSPAGDKVRRRRISATIAGSGCKFAWPTGKETSSFHQSPDTVIGIVQTLFFEFDLNASIPISA